MHSTTHLHPHLGFKTITFESIEFNKAQSKTLYCFSLVRAIRAHYNSARKKGAVACVLDAYMQVGQD